MVEKPQSPKTHEQMNGALGENQQLYRVYYLQLSDEINIAVVCKLVPDPILQLPGEPLVHLQPGCIKAQTQGGPVGAVVPAKEKTSLVREQKEFVWVDNDFFLRIGW